MLRFLLTCAAFMLLTTCSERCVIVVGENNPFGPFEGLSEDNAQAFTIPTTTTLSRVDLGLQCEAGPPPPKGTNTFTIHISPNPLPSINDRLVLPVTLPLNNQTCSGAALKTGISFTFFFQPITLPAGTYYLIVDSYSPSPDANGEWLWALNQPNTPATGSVGPTFTDGQNTSLPPDPAPPYAFALWDCSKHRIRLSPRVGQ
jgi:hypothetical protein